MNAQDQRVITRTIEGHPASDGAGFELQRVIGSGELDMLDPFLLLDRFSSNEPQDYIAGFPPHPHRGFETVTYLLAGRMRHKDSTGAEGVIESGGLQWMTAASGVIHSEMPEQEDGLLDGFQLWVNLPAEHKMDPAGYQEFGAPQIPEEVHADGTRIKVIAGNTTQGTQGPVIQALTDPLYLDITLPARKMLTQTLPTQHNGFVFVIEGQASIADKTVLPEQLGVLSWGDDVSIEAGEQGARLLLVAGKPLKEPVARGGPFVMNTREEIAQAFQDYQNGLLTRERVEVA